MCFIDYSNAFDSVSHKRMWNIMKILEFPTHVTKLLKELYINCHQNTVRTSYGDTRWFTIGRGVRQGCVLSPDLFNIYDEDIMREILEDFEGGIKIGGRRITNLRYADDTTLICNSKEELPRLLQTTKVFSEEKGLLLNAKKKTLKFFSVSVLKARDF